MYSNTGSPESFIKILVFTKNIFLGQKYSRILLTIELIGPIQKVVFEGLSVGNLDSD